MDADFPAAHSMDTQWYAVDAAGHVGVFDTGEDGHAPQGAENASLVYDLWQLLHPEATEEETDAIVFGDTAAASARLGLFHYEYEWNYDPINAYERRGTPAAPLHVDQLPPPMRALCSRVRFGTLDFARARLLQPLEHFPCDYWYEDSRLAYLASDGVTVRPIPGKEDRFGEFRESFQRERPEDAARLRFEAPGERRDADGR